MSIPDPIAEIPLCGWEHPAARLSMMLGDHSPLLIGELDKHDPIAHLPR
jgi:hypothetical protein